MVRILPDYERGDLILFQWKFMIYAGWKDYKTDSCQGDSEGPLMMKYNNHW